jgi:hypothetical protein
MLCRWNIGIHIPSSFWSYFPFVLPHVIKLAYIKIIRY